MNSRKLNLILFVALLACAHYGLLYSHQVPGFQFNPFDFMGLLKNHVIQMILCFSFSFTLIALNYVIKSDHQQNDKKHNFDVQKTYRHQLCLGLGMVLFVIGFILLIEYWQYIQSHFMPIVSSLLYYSYNPNSSDQGYYYWKYSISPPKAVMVLFFMPFLVLFGYQLLKLKRQITQRRNLP